MQARAEEPKTAREKFSESELVDEVLLLISTKNMDHGYGRENVMSITEVGAMQERCT